MTAIYQRAFIADLSGKPIDNGKIYVGVANQDPETFPVSCFWDAGLTVPASQPISVSAGYIVNAGSRADIFIAEATYSIRVRDKADVQVDYIAEEENGLLGITGSAQIGWKQRGTDAVARTVESKLQDTVHLKDYGAKLNGSDNDAAAWDKLYTAFPTGGVKVIVDGYCRINSTITPPSGMSNVAVDFQGGGYFYNPNHGFDMLHLPSTVGGWMLLSPKFYTDLGASGATSVYLLKNDSDDLLVHDFWGRNCWDGIFNSGAKVAFTGRTYLNAIKPTLGIGVVINMDGAEHFWLQDIYAENAPASDCLSGVQILAGSSIILGGTVVRCGDGLRIDIPNGKVLATLGLWPYFNADNGSQNGFKINATGTGAVQRLEGYFRGSSNAGNGFEADVAIDSADIALRVVDNGGRGAYLAYAGDQKNSRFTVAGGGNGVHTFEAVSGAVNWTARIVAGAFDGFGGSTQYGGVIGAACDHFTMDIDGVGDTLGLLFNAAGTSATQVVRSRA